MFGLSTPTAWRGQKEETGRQDTASGWLDRAEDQTFVLISAGRGQSRDGLSSDAVRCAAPGVSPAKVIASLHAVVGVKELGGRPIPSCPVQTDSAKHPMRKSGVRFSQESSCCSQTSLQPRCFFFVLTLCLTLYLLFFVFVWFLLFIVKSTL